MSHSFYRIQIHAIFGTKHRNSVINPDVREKIIDLIVNNFVELDCDVLIANAVADHVHILYCQNPKISVSETIGKVKGKTTKIINELKLLDSHFAWQTGFSVFSVSETQKDKVIRYIKNQEKHHESKTFEEEFEEMKGFHNL